MSRLILSRWKGCSSRSIPAMVAQKRSVESRGSPSDSKRWRFSAPLQLVDVSRKSMAAELEPTAPLCGCCSAEPLVVRLPRSLLDESLSLLIGRRRTGPGRQVMETVGDMTSSVTLRKNCRMSQQSSAFRTKDLPDEFDASVGFSRFQSSFGAHFQVEHVFFEILLILAVIGTRSARAGSILPNNER